MSHQMYVASALAACALACAASPAFADTVSYNFGSVAQGTTVTPYTLQGATFDSPDFMNQTDGTSTGAFTFGANGNVFNQLGSNVLSSGGFSAELSISFATAQTGISFDYANGDGYTYAKSSGTYVNGNGSDSLTVTTNGGYSTVINLAAPTTGNGALSFPQGFFQLAGAGAFTSLTITAADSQGEESLAISTLTSSPVPLPASAWFLLSGLGGAAGFARRRRVAV